MGDSAAIRAAVFWQSLGGLGDRGSAGLWYVYGDSGLGNERWNIGSRIFGMMTLNPAGYHRLRTTGTDWKATGKPRPQG